MSRGIKQLMVTAVAVVIAAVVTPALAVSGGDPEPAPVGAPWLVTLVSRNSPAALLDRVYCSGVLVRPDLVMTAGHCLDGQDATLLELHLGDQTLSQGPGRILAFTGVAVHPAHRINWSPAAPHSRQSAASANDVGVIQLAEPVKGVPVLALAGAEPPVGTPVQAFGHGMTKEGEFADAPKRLDYQVIGDDRCVQALGTLVDAGSVLCAMPTAEPTCAGDSGGPLVRRTERGPELVGLVSFGSEVLLKPCGDRDNPTGFADVTALRPWLDQPQFVLAPLPAGQLRITGRLAAGSTLSCQLPEWRGAAPDSVSYAWERADVVEAYQIVGATGPTLTLTEELAGQAIGCTAVARTAGGKTTLRAAIRP